jgi:hypothetical protein
MVARINAQVICCGRSRLKCESVKGAFVFWSVEDPTDEALSLLEDAVCRPMSFAY